MSYVIHFTPVLGLNLCAGDASKPRKEPLAHGTDGVGRGHFLVDPRVACRDVES